MKWTPYPGRDYEWACPHGVGHGKNIHGCDGCCSDPDFPPRAWDGYVFMDLNRDVVENLLRSPEESLKRWWTRGGKPIRPIFDGEGASIGLIIENGEPARFTREFMDAWEEGE